MPLFRKIVARPLMVLSFTEEWDLIGTNQMFDNKENFFHGQISCKKYLWYSIGFKRIASNNYISKNNQGLSMCLMEEDGCIHAVQNISNSENIRLRVLMNHLIVILKYTCICPEVEHVKFITVTCTQIEQVDERAFYITDVKPSRNQKISKITALIYRE